MKKVKLKKKQKKHNTDIKVEDETLFTKEKKKLKKIQDEYEKKSDEELEELSYNIVKLLEDSKNVEDIKRYELWAHALKTVLDKRVTNNYNDYNNKLYPYLNDPLFNLKILEKTQFNQHKISFDPKNIDEVIRESCNKNKFNLSSTQMFLKSFLSPNSPYNGCLIFHGTGVGKTCSSITIAEQFKDILDKNDKKIHVLVSDNIKEGFMKNIFNINKFIQDKKEGKKVSLQCTGNTYFNELGDKGNNLYKQNKIPELEKHIKKIIEKKYQFKGYTKFANEIRSSLNKACIGYESKNHYAIEKKTIKDLYSNSVIIIDEVHHIKGENSDTTKEIEKVITYAENVKLILMSATPMFDTAEEIVWILNMLLLNDKRPTLNVNDVFDSDGNMTEEGERNLIKYSTGYISFLRSENPFEFPARLYPDINNDKNVLSIEDIPNKWNYDNPANFKIAKRVNNPIKYLKLVKSEMSEYQTNIMNQFISAKSSDIKEGYGFQSWAQEISNVVFPANVMQDKNSVYGTGGFDNNFIKSGDSFYSYKKKGFHFLNKENLIDYSGKINTIINYIENSEGIVYINSRYIKSGAIPLAIALEHCGYTRYKGKSMIKNTEKENGKSYILITGTSDYNPNITRDIQACSDPKNKDGDIIKVIIGTPASSEGIDFKNIREVHILDPWYNINSNEQTIGRAIRRCSHIDLESSKRNVTIYYHVATFKGKLIKDIEPPDIYRYRMIEEKAIKMAKVERLLKQTAIDCYLNKQGNVYLKSDLNKEIDIITSQKHHTKIQLGDEEYSRTCNYSNDCDFVCMPEIQDEIELVNTSNIIIENSLVDKIVDKLNILYEKNDIIYDINEIKSFVQERVVIEDNVLFLVLDNILKNKDIVIYHKGREGYLIYRNIYYIWQPSNFDENISLLNRYKQPMAKPSKTLLNNLITTIDSDKDKKEDVEQLQNIIDKLNIIYSIEDKDIKLIRGRVFTDSLSQIEINGLLKHIIINNDNDVDFYKYMIDVLDKRLIFNYMIQKKKSKINTKEQLIGFIQINSIDKNIQVEYIYCDKEVEEFKKFNDIDIQKITQYFNNLHTTEIKEQHLNNLHKSNIKQEYGFIERKTQSKDMVFKTYITGGKGLNCTSLEKKDIISRIEKYLIEINKFKKQPVKTIKEFVKNYMPDIETDKKFTKIMYCECLHTLLRYIDYFADKDNRWFYDELEIDFIKHKQKQNQIK